MHLFNSNYGYVIKHDFEMTNSDVNLVFSISHAMKSPKGPIGLISYRTIQEEDYNSKL